jgi:hypothetical protein
MTAVSPRYWLQTEPRASRVVIALSAVLVAVLPAPMQAQSAGCNRARAIVDEVKELYAASPPNHRAILDKLRTAQQLCPTLGEAWKLAHCSALAVGDQQNARIFKDRAIFNGVASINCAIAGVGDAAAVTPLPSYVRQKHALVVGIGKFRDPAVPRLQYPAKDAADFAALLTDPKYGKFPPGNVTLLTDEQATRAAILNGIQQLFLRAHDDDLVVMFISSHGSPSQQEKGLGGVGYIVTYDTALNNIWVDAIEYQDLAQKASLIKARRKVTFLDTCYSGQLSKRGEKALTIDSAVDDRTAKMFLSGEGTFVITSSKANERSWESDDIHNGYFTHYLIEALKRAQEPPTLKEVFDYISSKVPDAVARDKQAPQHPQMRPSTGPGDVRIGVVPQPGGRE